jgi:hypothetical protein
MYFGSLQHRTPSSNCIDGRSGDAFELSLALPVTCKRASINVISGISIKSVQVQLRKRCRNPNPVVVVVVVVVGCCTTKSQSS